jgi:spore coat protein U-like protein
LIVGSNISSYTVYGRIPAGQDAAAGTYLDTIVVTVNY